METIQNFINRKPSYQEITGMRKENAIPAWDSPHPHGFRVLSGDGATLRGEVLDETGEVKEILEVDDGHGMIVSNGLGYQNPEIEGARRFVREKRGLDVVSSNLTSDVIEWSRATILETLGPDWALIFVGTGGEANDVACRVGFATGNGAAELIGLRNGYGGSTALQNALVFQPGWKGPSTLNIPVHPVGADLAELERLTKVLPGGRCKILRKESRRTGVGGFEEIPDGFTRGARNLVDFIIEDEVQAGMGRTGRSMWAFQKVYEGIREPDCVVAAKSLGATHRAAFVAVRKEHLDALKGSLTYHTFGGMEEDAAAMGTAVQIVQRDNLVENARLRGKQFQQELGLKLNSISFPVSLDGEGLMQAIVLPTSSKVAAVLKRAPLDGWIAGKGGFNGERIRVAPPLNVNQFFISGIVEKIVTTLRRVEIEAA